MSLVTCLMGGGGGGGGMVSAFHFSIVVVIVVGVLEACVRKKLPSCNRNRQLIYLLDYWYVFIKKDVGDTMNNEPGL